ncbi:MAG TPA: lytic transglycosylase domain-containing protein [Thermoleophilaceae bacterium]|nr:lytic transglycosylase domain-containing protein [Thermoleophilaceae bacterium]
MPTTTSPSRARTRSGSAPRRPARRGRSRARARTRRRRIAAVLAAAVVGGFATALATGLGPLGDAVREITLPLRHEDIIRQQAADKGIDSSLIAAVIYEESRFRDQTSRAGARGLMQITPATADLIARESGGTQFTQADLATPQVNIAYGSYYLHYLLDRYEGDAELAVAAYNAGPTQVDQWVEDAGGVDDFEADEHIPYPETRTYAGNVLEREREYRKDYADELGL